MQNEPHWTAAAGLYKPNAPLVAQLTVSKVTDDGDMTVM